MTSRPPHACLATGPPAAPARGPAHGGHRRGAFCLQDAGEAWGGRGPQGKAPRALLRDGCGFCSAGTCQSTAHGSIL